MHGHQCARPCSEGSCLPRLEAAAQMGVSSDLHLLLFSEEAGTSLPHSQMSHFSGTAPRCVCLEVGSRMGQTPTI